MIWEDFSIKFLRRVRYWFKNIRRVRIGIKKVTTRQILERNIYLKSMILRKKMFLKSKVLKKKIFFYKKHDFQTKLCTQLITFCFNSPRERWNFCVLRAYLKCTISKNFFLKKHVFQEKFFFRKAWLWIKNFSWCQILNQLFYNASDFELKISRRGSFKRGTIYLSPPHVLFSSLFSI